MRIHNQITALLLSLALLLRLTEQQFSTQITPSNTMLLSDNVDYSFQIYRFLGTTIPAASTIEVTFPIQYPQTITGVSCTPSTIACSYLDRKVSLTGFFPNSIAISDFSFSILGLSNPSPAKTYQIGVQIKDSNGFSETGNGDITIQMGEANCQANFSHCSVYQECTFTVEYTSSLITNPSAYTMTLLMAESYPSDALNVLIAAKVSESETPLSNYRFQFDYVSSFQVTMLMPPSVAPEQDFIAISTKQSEGSIDSCTLSITGISPNQLSRVTVSQLTVQEEGDLAISFQLNTPIISTDYILLNFSLTEFSFEQIDPTATFTEGSLGDKVVEQNEQVLKITDFTSSTIQGSLRFILKGIQAPFSQQSQVFTISTINSDDNVRDTVQFTYQADSGSLAQLAFTCSKYDIGRDTFCTITAVLSHAVRADGYMYLQFPEGFPLANPSTACNTTGGVLNLSPTCSINTQSRTLTISGLSSETLTGSSEVKVSKQFTLPVVPSSYSIKISMKTKEGFTIDTGTAVVVVERRRLRNGEEIEIIPGTYETNIETGFTLNLLLPVVYPEETIFTLSMTLPLRTKSLLTSNNSQVTVTHFNNTLSISPMQPALLLSGFITHSSTEPLILSGTISNNGIEYFYFSSYSLAMTTPSQFEIFTFRQSNQVVGEVFIATFNVSGLSMGDYLVFPAAIYDGTQADCSENCECQGSGRVQVTAVTNYTVIVVNLVNLQHTGSLDFTVVSYEQNLIYKKQTITRTLSTVYLNTLSLSFSQSKPYYNESSVYSLNVTLVTPGATHLEISIPESYSFVDSDLTCIQGCDFSSRTYSNGNLSFAISSTFIRFSLKIVNPVSNTDIASLDIEVKSKREAGYMDYNKFAFEQACLLPCRTCVTGICTTCYDTEFQENKLRNGTCVESCFDEEFYSTETSSCESCLPECAECSSSPQNCQACSPGFYLYFNSSQCLQDCPETFYNNQADRTCDQCSPNCLQCSNTSTCTLCAPLYFMYLSECWDSCPVGSYNSTTSRTLLKCSDCNQNCQSCTSSLNCSECQNGLYLSSGFCLEVCPSAMYPNEAQRCTACPSRCSACYSSNATVKCTGCVAGYKLYDFACQLTCGNGFYDDSGICKACAEPCNNCLSLTHCLSCMDTTMYMEDGNCVESCSLKRPNNQTMVCQDCRSPCSACIWSDTCTSCVASYNLNEGTCVRSCPTGLYADNGVCNECPQNCSTCKLSNNIVICTSCHSEFVFYGYLCRQDCPPTTTLSNSYCLSASCSDIANCLTCSALRCLACATNYTLTDTNCVEVPEDERTLAAVSELPVPFPFVIATIVIIVLAFLIRMQFPKMFAPLFIYSFLGLAEVGLFGLWVGLIYTKGIVDANEDGAEDTKISLYLRYAATIVCLVYGGINLVAFILYLAIVRRDRKYRVWEKQENRCSSFSIALISLLLTFRLSLLRYSKLGHLHHFSATLAAESKLTHEHILSYISILLISLPAIVISAWISNLQVTMNYLFFTSMEVTIFEIIIIIVSILLSLAPKGYVIENKDEYLQGRDSQNIEGESLEQVMMGIDVVEEEYHEGKSIHDEDEVKGAANQMDDDDDYGEGYGTTTAFITPKQKVIDERLEYEDIQIEQKDELKEIDEMEELENILMEAESLARKLELPSRPYGTIRKQNLNEIQSSSESEGIESSVEDEEPYPIDVPHITHHKGRGLPIIVEDPLQDLEQEMEMEERGTGMSKLKKLFRQIEEKEKEEKELRERLRRVTEEEKLLKEKEYEKARELSERNQMALEDKMARVQNLFADRASKQKARRQKIAEMEEQRRRDREGREKRIEINHLVYPPPAQNFEVEVIFVKNKELERERKEKEKMAEEKLRREKQEKEEKEKELNRNEEWNQGEEKINFESNDEWRITEEQHEEETNDRGMQLPIDAPSRFEIISEPYYPIDPELEEKINQVEQRADQYLKQKKPKQTIEEYDFSIESELGTGGEDLVYEGEEGEVEEVEEQEQEGEGDEEEGDPGVYKLEIEEGERIPKKRINRNVINLSPS